MQTNNDKEEFSVEFHIQKEEIESGLACSSTEEKTQLLDDTKIQLVSNSINTFINCFKLPEKKEEENSRFKLDSFEMEFSFSLEFGTGKIIKVLIDSKAVGGIKATVKWARK